MTVICDGSVEFCFLFAFCFAGVSAPESRLSRTASSSIRQDGAFNRDHRGKAETSPRPAQETGVIAVVSCNRVVVHDPLCWLADDPQETNRRNNDAASARALSRYCRGGISHMIR